MRALYHYLGTILLFILGGRLSPFIEGLDPYVWAAIVLGVFGILFIIRIWLQKTLVLTGPPEVQTQRQFFLDLILLSVGGAQTKLALVILYGVDLFGGLMVGLFGFVRGLFAGADMALEREYLLAKRLKSEGREIAARDPIFPMARKFMLAASFAVVLLISIIFLFVWKDIGWVNTLPPEKLGEARNIILLQFFIIGIYALMELLNLILSYSRNLDLFFTNQNEVLSKVAEGNLESRVPVSTQDEFGVMGKYTNHMIDELKARTHELQITQDVTILSLASMAELRHPETGAHILRTQRYVRELAFELKDLPAYKTVLNPENIELLFKSAPLHDIGKVGVPDAILLKPGKLTEEEFEEMKRHTIYGRDILQKAEDVLGSTSFLRFAREIAYTHQEKWDGTGYPQGLNAGAIPIAGRLMALADVYDALVSKRVYKEPFSHEETVRLISKGSGNHFDPVMVEYFLKIENKFRNIAEKYKEI